MENLRLAMRVPRDGDLLEPSADFSCTTSSSSLASSAWLPRNRVRGPSSDMSGAGFQKDAEVRSRTLVSLLCL